MKKRFRNPATGETIILEEEDEESTTASAEAAPSSGHPENPGGEKTETAENKEPESEEDHGEKSGCGGFRTPFDFLDEIDGKDVEKVAIGAALGIGGMLALRGLFSFIARE